MKLLVVYPYLPYPLDRGAYHRAFHLLKGLAQEHELHFIALAENGEGAQHARVFEEFCETVEVVRFQHPAWQKLWPDRLKNPLPSTIEHWNIPELERAVGAALAREKFAAAHVLDLVLMPLFLEKFTEIPLILDRTRVDLYYQSLEYRRLKIPLKARVLYTENLAKMWRFEKRVAERVKAEIVCGPDDATVVRRFVSRTLPVEVIPNGVDLTYFQADPAGPQKEERPTILFCGAMDYNPNVDGLRWYFETMHDSIVKAVPDMQFYIVGKDPIPEVKAYGQRPNVIVTGGVPDVRPYYQRAWMQIVPIRIGGGTRLKIVESLSMGTPVVSTTIGAQGLDLFHNEDALLADTPGAFVQQVVRGLKDATLRDGLVRRGKATVTARLSWDGLSAQLRSIYAKRLPEAARTERVRGGTLPQRSRQLAQL